MRFGSIDGGGYITIAISEKSRALNNKVCFSAWL